MFSKRKAFALLSVIVVLTFLLAQCQKDRSERSFRLDWILRAQYAQATLF